MKIISYNANGIRARKHQLEAIRDRYGPDIIGIQETKVTDEDFPSEMISELGYHARFFGQKTHYGVALLSKIVPVSVQTGFPSDAEDAQRRVISAVYELPGGERLTLVNGYFPQGEARSHAVKFPAKRRFYSDMMGYLNDNFSRDENLVVVGDMNVAPLDADVGIGEDNVKRWLRTGKCSFLPEEREWLGAMMDWGLSDTFRTVHPDVNDRFSWFDYRSGGFDRDPKRGLRIDLILATRKLNDACTGAGIAYDIRGMERPSDHCPVWASFDV